MSIKNIEIEFKYKAEVSLSAFKKFCESNPNIEKFVLISGYDHFYANAADPNSFYRHRVNTNENQLTFKKKTVETDSFIREERNIDLPLSVTGQQITDLVAVHGYKYNTSIFKNCFIYNYSYYTLVYYICYDEDLNEKYRFIEIEMREDNEWSSEEVAYSELVVLEKMSKALNISPDKRIKESLFELFRKEVV